MNTVLKDLVQHNVWATRTLIDFCRELSAEQLQATAPGAFSDIRETLGHMVTSEANYYRQLTGTVINTPGRKHEGLTMDEISERANELVPHWEAFLNASTDIDEMFTGRDDDGNAYEFARGVALAQVFNHANVHREQVSNILTVHGIEPPEISGWSYAFATGRGKPANQERT